MIDPVAVARTACEEFHASQRFDELAEAVAMAAVVGPRVVVEIGCDGGGTLYCWRQLGADVFGITLPDNSWETGGQGYPLNTHGAHVWLGDSHSAAAREWLVTQLAGRPVDVLHIDGDHSYDGVAADFATYAPLVRAGGLVLVHDVLNSRNQLVEVDRWWVDVAPHHRSSVIASKHRVPVGFGVIVMEES